LEFDPLLQVSGNKFYYLKNEAVLLEMALINWTLSKLLPKGFIPLSTPDLVRSTVVEKCGFQPRGQNTQVHFHFLSVWSYSCQQVFESDDLVYQSKLLNHTSYAF